MPRLNHGTLLENLVVLEVARVLTARAGATVEFACSFAMPPLTQYWHRTPHEPGNNPKFNANVMADLGNDVFDVGAPTSYPYLLRDCIGNGPGLPVVPYALEDAAELLNLGGPNGALLVAMLAKHQGQALRVWSNDLADGQGRYHGAYHDASTECPRTNEYAHEFIRNGAMPGADSFCGQEFPESIAAMDAWLRPCSVRIGFLDPDSYTGGASAEIGKVNSDGHVWWLNNLHRDADITAGIMFFASQNAPHRPVLIDAFHDDASTDYPSSVIFCHGNYMVGVKLRCPEKDVVDLIIDSVRKAWESWSEMVGRDVGGLRWDVRHRDAPRIRRLDSNSEHKQSRDVTRRNRPHTAQPTRQGSVGRQRGCLIGLAVGDALGAAVEFKAPGSFAPVVGYRDGGPHGLDPGEWTDDTSMALALADSIAQAGWNLDDQAARYVKWWRQGMYSVNDRCFDIGITTSSALARFERQKDARSSGDSSPRASGNGSIMRLAPVPIRFVEHFPDRVEELAKLAAESSLPTHASPQCLSACRYMAIVLAGLMHGLDREVVLDSSWDVLQRLQEIEPLHPEVHEVAAGSFRRHHPPTIQGSGYVVKSLEAALWAFHDARDFREAVLRAVNLGDDADTTGAVCGQLAGAYWGEQGIPAEWLQGLARREMLEQALAGLLKGSATLTAQPARRPALVLPTLAPPAPRSYWVVEGKFLAGAYPGSPDHQLHRERIEQLWNAGLRTFINLVEEDEKNNSGQAFSRYDDILRELARQTAQPVAHLRFPVRDLSVPTIDGMRSILDAIDLALAADRPVYLHCFGGVGRTGTTVCCWLLRHGLAEPHDVIGLLRGLREADRQTQGRKAPETSEQITFVKQWLGDGG